MVNHSVQVFEGIGCVLRGDLLLINYAADARLDRTRWVFDRADELAARTPGGIICMMLVPPTANPPDAATRAENNARFKKIEPKLRRMITVPLGDAFRVSLVRTVMRGIIMLQRQSAIHVILDSEEAGIAEVLRSASKSTPGRVQIITDIGQMRRALPSEELISGTL